MTRSFARRAVAAVLSVVVGLGAMSVSTAALPSPGRGKDEVKAVTVNLEFIHHEGISATGSYDCVTGTFAPFADLPGWEPRLVTWTQTDPGSPPREVFKDILSEAPYDDSYTNGPYAYPAAPGTHHTQLPTFPQYDGGPDNAETRQKCGQQVAKERAKYGVTAVVSYVRSSECNVATAKLDQAKKGLKSAKQAVRNAVGQKEKAAAQAKLKAAKAKLKKAKKKHKKACPK